MPVPISERRAFAKTSLRNTSMLHTGLIQKRLLHTALLQLLSLTMRSVILQPAKDGILSFSSVNLERRRTAGVVRLSVLLNQKDRNLRSWAVTRLTARLRVSAASIRLAQSRIPGRVLVSGRFLRKRLPSTSLSISVDFCSIFTTKV